MRMPKNHKKQLKIARMKSLSDEEEQDDVSTKLTLRFDPWTIKKDLTKSDLGEHSRLIIHTKLAQKRIIKYLSEEDQRKLEQGLAITINVYDHDTQHTFPLIFKKYKSSQTYVLNGDWRSEFVHRRSLKLGDQIGFVWNLYTQKLHFCVLTRSSVGVCICNAKNPNKP